MQTSIYTVTVPILVRGISNMLDVIAIMEKHAKKKKIDTNVFITGRLAPDMFNFIQQIQYIYFDALEIVEPLSGKKPPEFGYDEKTVEDLKNSLKKVLAYLRKIKPADYKNAESAKISLYWNRKKSLPAHEYVTKVGLPNFFFHCSIAYGIFRHLGVPLVKDNYLGKL